MMYSHLLSQYDKRKTETENCFKQYNRLDRFSRGCVLCSVGEWYCKTTTRRDSIIKNKNEGIIENLTDELFKRISRMYLRRQDVVRVLCMFGELFDFTSNLKPFDSENMRISVELQDFFKPVVYFLYNKNVLVYIGSTQALAKRLSWHIQDGKIFDSFAFFECCTSYNIDRTDLESALIFSYKTKYNKGRRIDADVKK